MTVEQALDIARKYDVHFEPGPNHGVSPAIYRAAVVLADALEAKDKDKT